MGDGGWCGGCGIGWDVGEWEGEGGRGRGDEVGRGGRE